MNSGMIQIIRRWTETPRFKWKRGTVVVNRHYELQIYGFCEEDC